MAIIYRDEKGRDVYERDGQIINAKTAEVVSQTQNAPQIKQPVGILSTNSGQQVLTDTQKNEARMTGVAPTKPSGEKPADKPKDLTQSKFINQETGQEYSFNEFDIEDPNNQKFIKDNNLQFMEGYFPKFLTSTPDDTLAQQELKDAKSDYQTAVNNLSTFNVSNDPQLASILSGIGSQWQARINEMERINKSRQASISTTGVRIGSRYTGGAGGMFGGIIAEEERQGAERVSALEAQKQAALMNARIAYEDKEYKKYKDNVDAARDFYDRQLKEVNELNKLTTENNKKIQEELTREKNEVAVSKSIADGFDNAYDIFNELGGKVPIKDINEFLKNIVFPKDKLVGEAADFESFITAGLIDKNLSKDEQWKAYQKLTGKDDDSITDKISEELRDYNYLNSLPNRGGLPENIQNPLQYIKYKQQLEKDIKPIAEHATTSPYGTPKMGTISSLEDINKLPVSNLTKSVMAGYIKAKELTPTDRAKVAEELYKVGFNPNQYITRKLEGLIALYSAMPDNVKGLVEGFLKPSFVVGHTEPTVGTFESAMQVLTRELARLNDVGVLSDQDVASYTAAMPSRMDKDIAQVIAKLSGLQLATGGQINEKAGTKGTLADGRKFIVGLDGETLLDPKTGKPL